MFFEALSMPRGRDHGHTRLQQAALRRLIGEATVDAYNDWEQATGFLTMIEDHLRCQGKRYRVEVTSLEWGRRPPPGAKWIEAYQAWRKGVW